jgi:hypothetical protein
MQSKTTKAAGIVGLVLSCAVVATYVPATASKAPTKWRTISVSSKGLSEVSGCAFSRRDPGRVWLHNDSGDSANVVQVDIASGAVGAAVQVKGVDAVDVEDIAMTSAGELIVADIGDNDEARNSVQLYRFPEPSVGAKSVDATRLKLTYPDGPHNAEALVVAPDGSAAFIFTKEPSGVAQVFRVDLTARGPQVLAFVGKITIRGEIGKKTNLITAADALGTSIIVRTYQFGYLLKAPSGGNITDAVQAKPRRFIVPLMVQGEAICASPNGLTILTASESRGADTFALAIGPKPTL